MRHMRSGTSFIALSIIAALFVSVMLGPAGGNALPQSPREAFRSNLTEAQ
jgi:hypothetical protein